MAEVPTIYDINIDERRLATQDDADKWMRQQQIIGQYLRAQALAREAYTLAITGAIEWQSFVDAFAPLEKLVSPPGPSSHLIDPEHLIRMKR